MLIHQLFQEQVRTRPEHPALRQGSRSVTFGELGARVDRVAAGLKARGLPPGALVGLHLERSVDWVVGLLAVFKVNGTVVPLPPSYPEDRTREVLDHAGLDLVVDHGDWPCPIGLPGPTARLEELAAEGDREIAAAPGDPAGDPEQAAFILCSSGSTGRPKMIVRSHRSFFHRLEWTWREHPFQPSEVGCQKAHMTTTHSIYELLEPLLAGFPAIIVPDDEVRDLRIFWQRVRESGVTRLLLVPSALRASLDLPGFEPPPLRVLVLMGEYLHTEVARRAAEAFPPETHLYSIYGSTEASSTLVCPIRHALKTGEDLPLGSPISPDIRVKILDSDLGPVEGGQEGRLYMAGPALFSGYLGDPAQTDAVTISLPEESEPFFDTRDQVRFNPNRELEFVGRVDDTVKIRGFRVDLREVERAILLHPQVTQSTVLPAEGPGGSTYLAGFYLPESAHRDAVYRSLRSHLPSYMVPSVLVGLEEFPLTSSGKVDRTRLLREYRAETSHWAQMDDLTDTEHRVGQVWEETLGHAQFTLTDSFFEVGGDSISVFSLAHGICDAFGLTVDQFPEHSVYASPTIRSLASRIDNLRSGGVVPDSGPEAPPLLVVMRSGRDPSLEPLFFISSAGGTVGAYNKLVQVLDTGRELIGIRDPYTWGSRDPAQGFGPWANQYLQAILGRQPRGPYFLCAYSTAGAFGLELASRLRAQGAQVSLLALVDPLALDRKNRWRYGYWALRATYMRPLFRETVRWWGRLRGPLVRIAEALRSSARDAPQVFTQEELAGARRFAARKGHILTLGALMELNTGLPFGLEEEDLAPVQDHDYLKVLQARFAQLAPDADPQMLERIAVQYELQVRTQHAYRLSRYQGPVFLAEPASPHAGILEAQLRPYLPNLESAILNLGPASPRTQELAKHFRTLKAHYRCMRDEAFVNALGRELDRRLDGD